MTKWALPPLDTYFEKLLTDEGFEIDHLYEALKFCKKFRTAIDGGAHVGTWSVGMAKFFKQVYAFEPSNETYRCLLKNTEGYNNIIQMHYALGAGMGLCHIDKDPTRVGNTGAYTTKFGVLDQSTGAVPGLTQIGVRPIDYYEITDLDFLKLDVEGSETLALTGASKTIEWSKPTIVVECKEFNPPRNGGVALTKKMLSEMGYKEVGGIRNDRVFVPA